MVQKQKSSCTIIFTRGFHNFEFSSLEIGFTFKGKGPSTSTYSLEERHSVA